MKTLTIFLSFLSSCQATTQAPLDCNLDIGQAATYVTRSSLKHINPRKVKNINAVRLYSDSIGVLQKINVIYKGGIRDTLTTKECGDLYNLLRRYDYYCLVFYYYTKIEGYAVYQVRIR